MGWKFAEKKVVPTNPAKLVLHCTTATNEKSQDELMCNKRIALNMRQSAILEATIIFVRYLQTNTITLRLYIRCSH